MGVEVLGISGSPVKNSVFQKEGVSIRKQEMTQLWIK